MDILLWKGFLIGLMISIPTGPAGFLCIRRSILYGFKAGVISGLGVVASDIFYVTLAVLGLSSIKEFIFENILIMKITGGLILLFYGLRLLKASLVHNAGDGVVEDKNIVGNFLSSFLVTSTNPIQIITIPVIVAAAGAKAIYMGSGNGTALFAGIISGSLLWWMFLSFLMSKLREKLSHSIIVGLNQLAGFIIAISGVIALLSIFIKI